MIDLPIGRLLAGFEVEPVGLLFVFGIPGGFAEVGAGAWGLFEEREERTEAVCEGRSVGDFLRQTKMRLDKHWDLTSCEWWKEKKPSGFGGNPLCLS